MKAPKVPKEFQKLHNVSVHCVNHLRRTKGIPLKEAEDMVLEVLKESEPYLKAGMVSTTIASLKMIFLDVDVSDAIR